MGKVKAMPAIGLACLAALSASDGTEPMPPPSVEPLRVALTPFHATYQIDGESITLHHGRAEQAAAPGSAARGRTSVWEGSPVYGDLDGDDDDDAALLLAQDLSSSGTFTYLVAAVRNGDGYQGGDAVFLGDRIGQPEVAIRDGQIHVRFKDHPEHAPLGEAPTCDRALRAKLNGLDLEALN